MENNILACFHFNKKLIGTAFNGVSTGEYLTSEGSLDDVDKMISNFAPKEILLQKGSEQIFTEYFGNKHYTYTIDEWAFIEDTAYDKLLKQFNTQSLKGFGVENMRNGIIAAGAIISYLELMVIPIGTLVLVIHLPNL